MSADSVAKVVVEKAMHKASTYLLGAVGWSIGLGVLNTLLLVALLIVVIVK